MGGANSNGCITWSRATFYRVPRRARRRHLAGTIALSLPQMSASQPETEQPSGTCKQVTESRHGVGATRPLKFIVAGTLGFAVDAAVLTALVTSAHWLPLRARLVSFLLAVSATWLINRY